MLSATGKRKRRRRKDLPKDSTPDPEPSQVFQEETNLLEDMMSAEEATTEDFSSIKDVANFEFESDGPASIGMFCDLALTAFVLPYTHTSQ